MGIIEVARTADRLGSCRDWEAGLEEQSTQLEVGIEVPGSHFEVDTKTLVVSKLKVAQNHFEPGELRNRSQSQTFEGQKLEPQVEMKLSKVCR